MEHSEIVYAIGWSMVAIGVLAVMLSSLTRHGYGSTTVGLILAFWGLLIAGNLWAAGALLALTLARYGYYLYLHQRGGHGEKEHDG